MNHYAPSLTRVFFNIISSLMSGFIIVRFAHQRQIARNHYMATITNIQRHYRSKKEHELMMRRQARISPYKDWYERTQSNKRQQQVRTPLFFLIPKRPCVQFNWLRCF